MAEPIRPAKGAKPKPRFRLMAIGEITGRKGMHQNMLGIRQGMVRPGHTQASIVSMVNHWLENMNKDDDLVIHIRKDSSA